MNIEANDKLKGRITVLDFALSNQNSKAKFYFSDLVDQGVSSASALATKYNESTPSQYMHVETRTVDDLVYGNFIPKPDLIKIDIEGAEELLLEGAVKTLVAYKPFLFLEIHSILNMFNVYSILNSCNYDLELLKVEPDGRCLFFASISPKKADNLIEK